MIIHLREISSGIVRRSMLMDFAMRGAFPLMWKPAGSGRPI